jgi:hypothetical protein
VRRVQPVSIVIPDGRRFALKAGLTQKERIDFSIFALETTLSRNDSVPDMKDHSP